MLERFKSMHIFITNKFGKKLGKSFPFNVFVG